MRLPSSPASCWLLPHLPGPMPPNQMLAGGSQVTLEPRNHTFLSGIPELDSTLEDSPPVCGFQHQHK